MTSGFYTGGTYGFLRPIGGVGGGVYVDTNGNYYPQVYYGTPGASTSTGYTAAEKRGFCFNSALKTVEAERGKPGIM
jgi:hypothetical protein